MTIADKLQAIAENEHRVYDAGYEKGKSEGGSSGDGGYDAFWSVYQNNGERRSYQYAFAGNGWTADTFKPKYDIVIANGQYMFRYSKINADLVEILERQGVVLDTSGITNTDRTFADAKFTRLGVLDFSNVTSINTTFANSSDLETIDKIILKDDGSNTFSTVFTNLSALKNITFEGVIGQNGINLQWSSSLTKASIENIISCLSATTSGLTITLSKNAKNKAFTNEEWNALVATKSNWTISLI